MPMFQFDPSVEGVSFRLGRAATLIDTAFIGCVEGQDLREVVQNGLDARATEIMIAPDWTYVAERVREGLSPVYRLSVWDNGCGMSKKQLETHLETLHFADPSKEIGKNLGIGARISLIPANPYGVIFMSWQGGRGHMIRLFKRPDGDYGLYTWDDFGSTVAPVPEQYNTHFDGTKREQGTLVICCGDGEDCNTFLRTTSGKGLRKKRTALKLLNSRYWSIPEGVKIEVWDPSGFSKNEWPTAYARSANRKLRVAPKDEDVSESNTDTSDTTVLNPDSHGSQYRTIYGTARYLGEQKYCDTRGVVEVPDARIHWFAYSGSTNDSGGLRCHNHNAYAPVPGMVGVVWNNEVYNIDRSPDKFNKLGVISRLARARLAFVVEPTNTADIATDAPRSRIGLAHGVDLPWANWGAAFARQMPTPIRDLLAALLPASTEFDADAVRKEIQDYLEQNGVMSFGAKKNNPKPNNGDPDLNPLDPDPENTDPENKDPNKKDPNKKGSNPRRPTVPQPYFNEEELNPKYIASFDIVGGVPTAQLYGNHPYIRDMVAQHAEAYPVEGAESTIKGVLAHIMLRRLGTQIAVAQLFSSKYKQAGGEWSADDVKALLSPESLTFACLDMVDLPNVIRSHLAGMMGTRRETTAAK
jgi:hypothetical protein